MPEIVCPSCGSFVVASEGGEPGGRLTVRCPGCGAEIGYRVGNPSATARLTGAGGAPGPAVSAPERGSDPAGERETPSGLATLFQPSFTAGGTGDQGTAAAAEAAAAPPSPGGTVLLQGLPSPPPLGPGQGGSFLVLGAPPGSERIPLRSARTVFGRRTADVDLGDPAVSERHFQVEVAGREIYVRDLQSRNGTSINGRRIRHAELRSGDELRAGSTYLVFATGDDQR